MHININNKKIIPAIAAVVLIVLVLAIVLISKQIQKYTPSKETQDLNEYFDISESDSDSLAIIYNQEVLSDKATLIDGSYYLDYQFVHDYISSRFYWDSNENILLYATDDKLISVNAESTTYYVAKDSKDFGKTVVKATSDSALVNIDFIAEYSTFDYEYFESPNRLVIYTEASVGNVTYTYVKKSSQIRLKGGIKSPILSEVEKNTKLNLLDKGDKWSKVMTESGIIGYIKNKCLTDKPGKDVDTSDFALTNVHEYEFSHITEDFEICMGWHQVTTYSANSEVANVLASTKGVNVISPTWFYLNDNSGNIADLASSDYVTYCHSQGVEVWALISNLENSDVDTEAVLSHTSTRQNLINQILSVAIKYELDGINVDIEALNSDEVGEAYIEFIRELSIKCGNNGIVLSVDNYVPTDYTAFYDRAEQANFADYVVMMGYDEHYAGSEEAGSVASLSWVTTGVADTISEVPSSQVILGMPFYTRVWASTPTDTDEEDTVAETDEADESTNYEVTSQAYGMNSADNLVNSYGAEKIWDDECGQYYATWNEGSTKYEVWLEDSESCEARLKLLDEYSLAGAAFWKLGFETSSTWDTVIKYIN